VSVKILFILGSFLECGQSEKAAEAAISAKEWPKALEILEVLERSAR
jgi:hypothetical protein